MTKEEAAKNRAFRRKCMFAGIFLAACLLLVLLQKVKEEKEKKRLTFSLAGEEEASKEDVSRELLEEEKESVLEEPKVREVEKETLGIDVSRFQEEIDWAQVAEAGIDFAMVRIGAWCPERWWKMTVLPIICGKHQRTESMWGPTFFLQRSMRKKSGRKPNGYAVFWKITSSPIRLYTTVRAFRRRPAGSMA